MTADDWKHNGFLNRCQSPIELAFGVAWLNLVHDPDDWLFGGVASWKAYLDFPEYTEMTILHRQHVEIVLEQEQIDKYRVDFVLGRFALDLDFSRPDNPVEGLRRLPLIVVECDGHDYHERTKEQAQRDKSRDRRLNQLGFRVLRFTGSELHRDAARCASEVDALFKCLQNPEIARQAIDKESK